MNDGEVHLTREGAVARITFDRPTARNAMTWHMYERLRAICEQLAGDRDVRVAVFRGAGGQAFIAGTDIAQFLDFNSGENGVAYEDKMEHTLGLIEALPMPTLAVIEGWATCASRRRARASACRSRARSATACRSQTMRA
jgi:enoyl-CoA hydratase/carnithine racemase